MVIAPEIIKRFKRLTSNTTWSFANAGRSETNCVTHGYHRYPAKFIPQIVSKIIKKYTSDKDLVCDPFGGCGTTLVEAKRLGRISIGFDINPIAKLITQTKVTLIKPKTLEKQIKKILLVHESAPDISFEHHLRISYWFDSDTVLKLDKIYYAIKNVKNRNVKRFFLCAFSHILKNCSRWLMKSIKPTIDKDKVIPEPIEIFMQHVHFMAKKNVDYFNELSSSSNLQTRAKMRRCNSSQKLPLESGSVNLIITSPPYVTSYEYADLHQLSLHWFNNDEELFKKWPKYSNDFNHFRKKFIGTIYKKKRNADNLSAIADQIVKKLACINNRLADNVFSYFTDMKKVFTEMHRILKPNGKVCVIIGNTMLKGVEILNA